MKEYFEGMIISLGKAKIDHITVHFVDFQIRDFIGHAPIIRIDRKAFEKWWMKKQRIQQKKAKERRRHENA